MLQFGQTPTHKTNQLANKSFHKLQLNDNKLEIINLGIRMGILEQVYSLVDSLLHVLVGISLEHIHHLSCDDLKENVYFQLLNSSLYFTTWL